MGRKFRNALKNILTVLIVAAVPALLFLYAWQAKKNTDLLKEISQLERSQEKLIDENKKLVSDISVLTSAERIERLAEDELKMHKAESEDIVRVELTGEKK